MTLIPSKVRWRVDLTKPVEETWSSSVLKKVRVEKYREQVAVEWLPASKIGEVFAPLYDELIVAKHDYLLNPEVAHNNILLMSQNPEYRLLWLVHKDSGQVYGGTIIRLTEKVVKIAYRAYNHDLARQTSLRDLDYFADYVVSEYAKVQDYKALSHGKDTYPRLSLGLPFFKLCVGARPMVVNGAPQVERESYGAKPIFYFDKPREGYYTRANFVNFAESELVASLVKLLERVQITVTRVTI